MSRQMTAVQLGRMGFMQAWNCQKYFEKLHLEKPAGDSHNSNKNTLLLVEHNPVYTIGLRTKGYTEEEEVKLRSLGAEFFRTNRGGLITFHGPGQLVVYPILNMKNFRIGMRDYVCLLEKTVIECCAGFGLKGVTSPHTGVWVNDKKITAIGVHGRRYITTHGIGINCNTDMGWFKHIVPCGIVGKQATSFTEQLGRDTSIEEVQPVLLKAFSTVFDCEVTDVKDVDQSIVMNSADTNPSCS